jgi:hypothetical protein
MEQEDLVKAIADMQRGRRKWEFGVQKRRVSKREALIPLDHVQVHML